MNKDIVSDKWSTRGRNGEEVDVEDSIAWKSTQLLTLVQKDSL